MSFILAALSHTPVYVWALLAYLVWQGALSLRPREQSVPRMLIVPAIFAATGLLLIVREPAGGRPPLLAWAGGAALLVPVGLATGPVLLGVDRHRRLITRAGSTVPLARNLVLFTLQYGLAVATALRPEDRPWLTLAGHAVSGASIGYFAGWAVTFRRRYRAAT